MSYSAHKKMSNDTLAKKTPGERLKYIRENLLKLSRADVFTKYGMSPDTLAAWENGKIQVSEKGIEKCIKIYTAENLIVSREWLLTGEGLAPNFSFDLNRYFKTLPNQIPGEKIDDNINLIKEIDFFRSLSSNSVTGLVPNNDMLPLYSQGDYVGGRLRYAENIKDCIGKDCIIMTKDGAMYIRRIMKSHNNLGYNLVCINPEWHGNQEPVLYNIEIECAAPIIWHRRPDD